MPSSANKESDVGTHILFLGVLVAASFAQSSHASDAAQEERFQLSGVGTLRQDAPVHRGGDFKMKASLDTSNAALRMVQEGGGFSLIAQVSSASMVCYSDTIFRDDFDGDGS
jgi:hypothetical protein